MKKQQEEEESGQKNNTEEETVGCGTKELSREHLMGTGSPIVF